MTRKTAVVLSVLGNTERTPIKEEKKFNAFCFTRFDYTDDHLNYLKTAVEKNKENKYIFGHEICPKTQKKHLQCYIWFKLEKTYNNFRKFLQKVFHDDKTHFEHAKEASENNYIYCSKEGNFITNMKAPRRSNKKLSIKDQKDVNFKIMVEKTKALCLAEYANITWRPFQKEILKIIMGAPSKRQIYWYWEPKGNMGKSFLIKYIKLIHNDLIESDGCYKDIAHSVIKLYEQLLYPHIITLDIPRCVENISYKAIEKLKDGQITSGKYEGGSVVFPSPHIIIFSNEPPIMDHLSADRWIIKEIIE